MTPVGLQLSRAVCISQKGWPSPRKTPSVLIIVTKDIIRNECPIVQRICCWNLWTAKLLVIYRVILSIGRTKYSSASLPIQLAALNESPVDLPVLLALRLVRRSFSKDGSFSEVYPPKAGWTRPKACPACPEQRRGKRSRRGLPSAYLNFKKPI